MHGDGDGWVTCDLGHRHWGLNGAAGLLITDADRSRLVLQHRAERTHEGDTWGLPGGARDSHEDAVDTALREAGEEAGVDPATVAPVGFSTVDHGGWRYTTVIALAVAPVNPHAANWESSDVRWCDLAEVDRLPLHPGFADSWPSVRAIPRPVQVVVDMANVVGSRPDGWWRDRLGANAALRERIVELARRGVDATALPDGVPAGSLERVFPQWLLVVEGAAAAFTSPAPSEWWERQTHVVSAPGAGDNEIVARSQDAGPDGPQRSRGDSRPGSAGPSRRRGHRGPAVVARPARHRLAAHDVHILLPPSEGKNPGGGGPSLAVVGFGSDAVGRHRRRLSSAVERAAGRTRRTAMAAFVLPEAVADAAIAANAVVTSSPTMAALDRYAGVVYAGLDVATLSPDERHAADEQILVFSGLWGVVGGGDPVPDYRVPAASTLARIGPVGSSWRPILARALPDRLADGVVVDLRSSDYAAMWRAPSIRPVSARPEVSGGSARVRTVPVRIMTEMPDGRLMVVSYVSKLAKGRLARELIRRSAAGDVAQSARDVERAWVEAGLGHRAPGPTAVAGRLDLVTAAAG